MTNRHLTVARIRELNLRRGDISRLAGTRGQRVSDYMNGRPIPRDVEIQIERTVEEIQKVYTAFPVKLDLSDIEGFRRVLQIINHIIAQDAELAAIDYSHS